jgi:DNA-directed RNA polymerase subunit F
MRHHAKHGFARKPGKRKRADRIYNTTRKALEKEETLCKTYYGNKVVGVKIVGEEIISFPEALALLTKRQKEGELSYEQQNTLAYLQGVTKLSEEDAGELAKELQELGLTEKTAVTLANIFPSKEEDIRMILAQDKAATPEKA